MNYLEAKCVFEAKHAHSRLGQTVILLEQIRTLDKRRLLGYVAQFPAEQLSVQPNGYMIPLAAFLNNWNLYWAQVINQQPMSDAERENRTKMLQKLAKEVISRGLKASGNHAASTAFDAMCAITADNVAEAVLKALSVIAAVR